MITCHHCNHQNPVTAEACSACLTPLPVLTCCPNCGAATKISARFCGQCGFNLRGIQADIPEAFTPNPSLIPMLSDDGGAAAMPTLNLAAPPGDRISFKPLLDLPGRISLLHLQTQTLLDLPVGKSLIHLGKPNDRIPPDVDLSGFPNTEIVSRIHAALRTEGNAHYLEDVGSANGTYINNAPLNVGIRHRLSPGDRISLGKGDKVTFIFQTSS
jgi:FHA domain/Double zinc ribbon